MKRALAALAATLALTACADAGFEAALAQAEAQAALARQSEVDTLYAFMRETHPALFHHGARERVEAEVAQLRARAPRMFWPEYVAGLARVLKLVGDAETTLVLPESGPGFDTRLPVEIDAFGDGWFVTHSAEPDAIGARVLAIEGKPIDEASAALAECWPHENGMWVKRAAPELLRRPGFLVGCGIARDAETVALAVELSDGLERAIATRPSAGAVRRISRGIVPAAQTPACSAAALPGTAVLYANFTGCDTDARVAGLAQQLVAVRRYERLVLDVRSRVDSRVLLDPLLDAIERAGMNRAAALFALIGRETSATSMRLATQLERRTQALFVGEPTGSAPNHYGAARELTLPHSQLRVFVATTRFEDSDPADTRFTLEPDIPAWQKLEDWRAGRDAALEAALRYRAAADAKPFDPRERWRTPRGRKHGRSS
jgi:hypothetical protein